jgi:hypothetical protein
MEHGVQRDRLLGADRRGIAGGLVGEAGRLRIAPRDVPALRSECDEPQGHLKYRKPKEVLCRNTFW